MSLIPVFQNARRVKFSPASLPGLVSWWKLEEASGTRFDSFGSNHLTDNNTVGQAAGKVGNAAQFIAGNSEYLSISDNPGISTGDIDFSIACGAYLDSDATGYLVDKGDGAAFHDEYAIRYSASTKRFSFWVDNGSAQEGFVVANSLGAPSLLTWYLVVAWHDSVLNTVNIQVNNGAVDSAAYAFGGHDNGLAFMLGRRGTVYWNGRIDEALFAKSIWTAGERANLYNWFVSG